MAKGSRADSYVVAHTIVTYRVQHVAALGAWHRGEDIAADPDILGTVATFGRHRHLCRIVRVELNEEFLRLFELPLRWIGSQPNVTSVLKFVDDVFVDPDANEAEDHGAEHDHDDCVPATALRVITTVCGLGRQCH